MSFEEKITMMSVQEHKNQSMYIKGAMKQQKMNALIYFNKRLKLLCPM